MSQAARDIESLEVAPVTTGEFVDRIIQWAQSPERTRLITYLNAHNVNVAFENAEYRETLKSFDLIYADGMAVVWGWRKLGRDMPERVNAGDFIAEFCDRAARAGVSLYMAGGRPGVAEHAARAWTQTAAGLTIAGTRDGYFDQKDESAIADEINAVSPGVVLIGMGVPRQELFAHRLRERIHAPVIWCVGALFEYWGEGRPRAPVWMRRAGLEWAFRLMLEPRRLARRYLIGNLKFLRNLRRLIRIKNIETSRKK